MGPVPSAALISQRWVKTSHLTHLSMEGDGGEPEISE